jgi:hypothetical protein
MDLLYVLGPGSVWQDNELRYSLRSVEQYLPHDRVVIAGHLPPWLVNVVHVDIPSYSADGIANTWNKVLMCAVRGEVSGDFLLMNDDFLATGPIAQVPSFSSGPVYDRLVARDMHGNYRAALNRSYDLLRSTGHPYPLAFETHHPLPMHAQHVLDMHRRYPMRSSTYAWRTVYGNFTDAEPTITGDVKARTEFHPPTGVWYSYGDKVAAQPEFRSWCASKWPEASRYERE